MQPPSAQVSPQWYFAPTPMSRVLVPASVPPIQAPPGGVDHWFEPEYHGPPHDHGMAHWYAPNGDAVPHGHVSTGRQEWFPENPEKCQEPTRITELFSGF